MSKRRIKLPQIDPAVTVREVGDFIVNEVVSANMKGGVVGLSGGADSTTLAFIAKWAFSEYNTTKPKQKLALYGVILPSHANPDKDMDDGIRIAKLLGIEYKVFPIQAMMDQFISTMKGRIVDEYDQGNLASEVRAICLSREARHRRSLILGTGNKDEDYGIKYFTKRGDGAADNNPMGNLPKRLVREVGAYIGAPEDIVQKTPAAGLWVGQTDEGELGFNYSPEAETVIAGKDQGFSRDELVDMTGFGYVRRDDESGVLVVDKILHMHEKNKFKLKMPPVAEVTLSYE